VSVVGVGGFLFGGLVGLLLRPVLNSYLQWRHVRDARATRDEIPTYPFLNEKEDHNPWPM
jgi:hypothetical protein